MNAGKLSRLKAELPPGEEQVLTITVIRIGDKQQPIRTFELRGIKPTGRRRWTKRH